MENNNKPRMRDLAQSYELIKALDADTALSKYALRRIFLGGEVATITVGRRRLVDFNALLKYLSGSTD